MVDSAPSVIDCEIRPVLERVLDANRSLKENKNPESQESVCIETRAACAVFEDVSSWSGRQDKVAQKMLIDAITESVRLLTEISANERIIKAVRSRLKELRTFDVSRLAPGPSTLHPQAF
jgi:hypothetical protein